MTVSMSRRAPPPPLPIYFWNAAEVCYGYDNDPIGNRLTASANAATNVYAIRPAEPVPQPTVPQGPVLRHRTRR